MQPLPPISVLKIALPVPIRQTFDYLGVENMSTPRVGQRAVVLFGRRKMVGVIVEISNNSELPIEKLSRVIEYPDENQAVLTRETLDLLKWCWRYYKHA